MIDAADGVPSLDELVAAGAGQDRAELDAPPGRDRGADIYTIIYTSGTTGPPKGTVLTHANALSVSDKVRQLGIVAEGDTLYLYLPLAHVFALASLLGAYGLGATVVYFGGDTQQILQELIETKPTYVPSVPRVFEKLYGAALKLQAQASEEDRERFAKAIELGVDVRQRIARGEEIPAALQQAFDQADERLYQRVRGLFGGEVKQAITGAAPIAPEILEFFYACGVPVMEGWGMTETTAVATVCTLEPFKFGTVGRDDAGRRGADRRVRRGDPDPRRQHLPRVLEQPGGDRGGARRRVAAHRRHRRARRRRLPEDHRPQEGHHHHRRRQEPDAGQHRERSKASPFISQAVMHGDRRPYPVALISLDPEEILPWAADQGFPEDLEQLAEAEQVVALVQAELDRANANYAQVEQIKRFAILKRDLSIDDGELTPTLKVKRMVVNDRYAELLDSLYS